MSTKHPDFSRVRTFSFKYPSWSLWIPRDVRDLLRIGKWYSTVRPSTQDEIDNFEDMYENEIEFRAHVDGVDLDDPYAHVALSNEMNNS